ncbi:MAG TPA: bifunctional diguanylate cyclase/phosphodiesterase [Steroidobacteraceae bacterium]
MSAPIPSIEAYLQIARSLWPSINAVGLRDASLRDQGTSTGLHGPAILKKLKESRQGAPVSAEAGAVHLFALPVASADGAILGYLLVQEDAHPLGDTDERIESLSNALAPLLTCLVPVLQPKLPARRRVETLTERSAELEWLFQLAGRIKSGEGDQNVLQALLSAAAARINAAFVGLDIPGKRILHEHAERAEAAGQLQGAWQKAQAPIATWLQRQRKPLLVNKPSATAGTHARCKVLAVPVEREDGIVIGALAFYRLLDAEDFGDREIFVARHLGRQAAQLVDSQFDLMTGLYTQAGLEQNAQQMLIESEEADTSIWYLDIDHLHVANQLHGFEVGNELIVRVADLLAPPLLPENALAARLGTDHFAVVLPRCSVDHARSLAENFAAAAAQLQLGPKEEPLEVSVSCGIAAMVNMAQGFARALAAAEMACKSAKGHGRGRVEVYNFDNDSMMRRHGDVMAIGRLRSALKFDKLALYAQPIVPLRGDSTPASYEILLRLQDENGEMTSLGPLVNAAHRYQLLPSIDKWVAQRALDMLAPYRNLLSSRGVGMSINVSGQSIGDETFVAQFAQWIKAARLPHDCITIEITEQAAVTNLKHANKLMERLKDLGCQFALDDFGTGSNSLTTLNGLGISRVKIDGSFVKNVVTDRNSHSTVRAIVELAAGLSIDTVAEFVETEEIAAEVRELGVDYAQGYAYGRPRPLKDILSEMTLDESQRLHRLFLES